MDITMITKRFALVILFILCKSMTFAQTIDDCEAYHWPQYIAPCPEVQIMQKHNHTPKPQYRHYGWDTVIDCNNRREGGIILSCMPYIPVQFFNGTYTVEQIAYNPPDTSFYLNYNAAIDANNPYKKKLAIQNDDDWAPSFINIAFPFYFFGIQKTQFLLGDNGIVTFANGPGISAGGECPYATTTPLPWPSSVPNSPSCNPALMRDAIYGVYEDTYTGSNGSYMSGTQGIYYGVLDNFPCRKIIASWNQIPVFSNQNLRQTYQIVCYEGSNIIEVHIKKRNCCSSTNGGNGLIGIQNATGQPQVPAPAESGAPNEFVANGSPAAFWPNGYNVFTDVLDTIAFRFTPQGVTNRTSRWYRIFDDGRDSVVLSKYDSDHPEAVNDTNGYYYDLEHNSSCPNLTKAVVNPSVPSKYVYQLIFRNANGDRYFLQDTIFVGIDTLNTLTLSKNNSEGDPHVYNICQGSIAASSLSMTSIQDTQSVQWYMYREHNGEMVEMANPRSLLRFGNMTTRDTVKVLPVTLNTAALPSSGTRNKIDSVWIRSSVEFSSGCENYDQLLIRIYPNFDTVIKDGICDGETYTWEPSDNFGHSYSYSYTKATNPDSAFVTLTSTPGCDSTVHLLLEISAVSHTIDHIQDCKPIVWLNGQTYSQTNTATTATDTVVLKNRYQCDSVVQLDFTLYPLTARLRSNVEQFTFDNLDAVLTDISTNGNDRVWKLPSAPDQTSVTAYYSIPVELDGAEILLIESSEYGCIDTASIYIPFNKENFWMPNVFTPDNPNGNNRFGSVSRKTLYQEMLIYNRRGELVFRCKEPDCSWDGRDLNGNPCVQDAYVYIIRYTNEFEPNNTKVIKGTVTLLR